MCYGQTTTSFAVFLLKKSQTKTGLLTSLLLTKLKIFAVTFQKDPENIESGL
jgi:hypothetical protein